MDRIIRRATVVAALIVACVLSVTSCDTAVDPFIESDRQLSLFGTIDMASDTHFVRVVPIVRSLEDDSNASFSVEFRSIDTHTGDMVRWRDSLIHFSDGTRGHVFYGMFRARPGHRYRIEASPASSDVVTSAETTVPAELRGQVLPEVVRDDGFSQQLVLWNGIDELPHAVNVWYRFMPTEQAPFVDVRIPESPVQTILSDGSGTLQVRLDLDRHRHALDTLVAIREMALLGLAVEVSLLDDQFRPPGGVFDREVLAQPDALSNVVNGFGFVGSIGRFSVEWFWSDDVTRSLGYRTRADILGANRETELNEDRTELLYGLGSVSPQSLPGARVAN